MKLHFQSGPFRLRSASSWTVLEREYGNLAGPRWERCANYRPPIPRIQRQATETQASGYRAAKSCDGDAISFKRVFQAVLAELFLRQRSSHPQLSRRGCVAKRGRCQPTDRSALAVRDREKHLLDIRPVVTFSDGPEGTQCNQRASGQNDCRVLAIFEIKKSRVKSSTRAEFR